DPDGVAVTGAGAAGTGHPAARPRPAAGALRRGVGSGCRGAAGAAGRPGPDPAVTVPAVRASNGAGDGDRTRAISLGSCCTTIELHPRGGPRADRSGASIPNSAGWFHIPPARGVGGVSRGRVGWVGGPAARPAAPPPRPRFARTRVARLPWLRAALRPRHSSRTGLRASGTGPVRRFDGPALQRGHPPRPLLPALRQPQVPGHRPGRRAARTHPPGGGPRRRTVHAAPRRIR